MSLKRRTSILKAAIPALLALSFSSGLYSDSEALQFEMLPSLPQPVTNNAVALLPDGQGRVFFAGGSVNPYNFNGIGYNGVPSEPEAGVLRFKPVPPQTCRAGIQQTSAPDP